MVCVRSLRQMMSIIVPQKETAAIFHDYPKLPKKKDFPYELPFFAWIHHFCDNVQRYVVVDRKECVDQR
ncbi:hypothetical protein JTE90_010311 [Oedothorax gibbosus]|uniref:Uncharacterized protein n=1 Tax=Oedothorax gibbosus TaxID=931172 RepID=A0AAV6V595_9ARAC|nr:hypothetical protein JTE90_010311 [Oedothorax gibbosus]